MNIYDLYITRCKSELDYFYKLVHFLSYIELNDTFLQLVHLDFRYNSVVPNIKLNNSEIFAHVYTFSKNEKKVYKTVIYNY